LPPPDQERGDMLELPLPVTGAGYRKG
jgi:hypothetical protein